MKESHLIALIIVSLILSLLSLYLIVSLNRRVRALAERLGPARLSNYLLKIDHPNGHGVREEASE